MRLRKLFTAIATTASLALTMAIASPLALPALATGAAQSLPTAGDSLFAMASNGTGKGFGSIDVSTGAAIGLVTARATTPRNGDVFTGGAYNPTTGTAYVINEINGSNQTLQSVDPVTGVLTTVAIMWEGAPTSYRYVRSIAIADDGTAYAIVTNRWLYSLNLTTAELTLVGNTGLGDLASLAINPVDDLLYAVDGNNGVFTLNTTTGAPTKVGENSASMCGFQIDVAGVAWYKECGGNLFSATNLTDIAGSAQDHGAVTIDELTPQIWAILYVPAAAVPTVPRVVTAGTATATSVPLSWTVPLRLYGKAVTDYVIQFKATVASSWTTFNDGVGTSTAGTVTGLNPATSYQFQVAAVTIAGSSEYSTPVTAATLSALSGIATVPRTLKAGSTKKTSVSLSWKVPSNLNGGTITDYVIQFRKKNTTSWLTFAHTASAATTRIVTGLKAKTAYQFMVSAHTAAGDSPFTAPISKTTAAH